MATKCEICGKWLENRRKLTEHLKNEHPETQKLEKIEPTQEKQDIKELEIEKAEGEIEGKEFRIEKIKDEKEEDEEEENEAKYESEKINCPECGSELLSTSAKGKRVVGLYACLNCKNWFVRKGATIDPLVYAFLLITRPIAIERRAE
jgi:predicted RNA-binding Zn-ribbon protein involved in translation (DUF1610 family)